MRERALEIAAQRPRALDGRNLLREYLQSRILGALQEAGAMVPLAFMGGTALRFLYRQPRFSEDLDFTLERAADDFSFSSLAERVVRQLEREGYELNARVGDTGAVVRAWFAFGGLLADAGLSPHADEVLKVLLEVDTRPPAGAVLEVSVVDRFGPLRLQHHDLSSLYAGKITAVLARPYTKGRDLYDLMWYLTRTPSIEPNAVLLTNSLTQVAPDVVAEAEADWRTAVRARLARVDWYDARRDLASFLEQSRDVDLIEAATFEQLLQGSSL
ncbi:MAG: nucleotidyl transferase AbiEii/AbiGii toxin family protein [Coriobacteriia bacterium]|nr:nucleotidyl transferase AbiEii/AbiGii toxin family protein [Coriobacteriia bacterium]